MLQLKSTKHTKKYEVNKKYRLPELSTGQSSLSNPQGGRSGGKAISSVRSSISLKQYRQYTKLHYQGLPDFIKS